MWTLLPHLPPLAACLALPTAPALEGWQADSGPAAGLDGFELRLIEAGDAPIQVELGHAAPLFRDFDGDGLEDLLVGQFGDGLLRIYKNIGRRGAPAFDRFEWFKTQSGPGSIPAG